MRERSILTIYQRGEDDYQEQEGKNLILKSSFKCKRKSVSWQLNKPIFVRPKEKLVRELGLRVLGQDQEVELLLD
jgi:hypothetical protein